MSELGESKSNPLLKLQNPQLQRAVERLVNNADLQLVLTSLQDEYISMIKASAPDERDLREECYQKISAYSDLQDWLKHYGTKPAERRRSEWE